MSIFKHLLVISIFKYSADVIMSIFKHSASHVYL